MAINNVLFKCITILLFCASKKLVYNKTFFLMQLSVLFIRLSHLYILSLVPIISNSFSNKLFHLYGANNS